MSDELTIQKNNVTLLLVDSDKQQALIAQLEDANSKLKRQIDELESWISDEAEAEAKHLSALSSYWIELRNARHMPFVVDISMHVVNLMLENYPDGFERGA